MAADVKKLHYCSFANPFNKYDILDFGCDSGQLLGETHRVLKAGGKVIFAQWDWATQVYVYCTENKEVMRKFVAEFSDWQQGWMEILTIKEVRDRMGDPLIEFKSSRLLNRWLKLTSEM